MPRAPGVLGAVRRARAVPPAGGQCDCFPGRGWTGAARRVRGGFYPWRGECQRKHPAPHPPPPRAPTYIFPPRPPARTGKSPGRRSRSRSRASPSPPSALLRGERRGRDREVRRGTQGGKPGTHKPRGGEEPGSSPRFRAATLFLLRRRGRARSPTAPERKRRGGAGNRSGETVPGPLRARGAARVRTRRVRVRTRRARAPPPPRRFRFRPGRNPNPARARDDATDLRLAEASCRSYASGEPDARRPRPGRRGSRGGTRGGTRRFVDPAARTRPRFLRGARVDRPRPALRTRTQRGSASRTPSSPPPRGSCAPSLRPGQARRGSRGDDDAGADLLGLPSEPAARRRSPGRRFRARGRRRGAERRDAGLPPSRGVQLATRARRRRRWRSRWRRRWRPTRGGGRGEGCWCRGRRRGEEGRGPGGMGAWGVRLVFCRGGTLRSRRSG